MSDTEVLIKEAEEVGVCLGRAEAEAMLGWLVRVQEAPFNISAIRDAVEGRRKHVVDSLSCLPLARLRAGERCLDLGSGGGFPGIPVAVVCPNVDMVLVDASGKKASFLRAAVAELGLRNVTVEQARAEDLGRDVAWRERTDCVLARAVAPLRVLLEYGLPLCQLGGRLLALKGKGVWQELGSAERAARTLGGRFGEERMLELPGGGKRVIVRIDKMSHTPSRFPRSAGTPARRPL